MIFTKKFFILSLILVSFLLTSCGEKKDTTTNSNNPITENEISSVEKEPAPTEKFYFPYTGEETSKELSSKEAFMAIIENSTAARPQSGLSEADLVYETLAEGGISRFISIYHKNSPEKLGPIRSVRPYFITLSKEHDLAFAHCGGSKEALDSIKFDSSIQSLNEFKYGPYYFRDNTRKAPHNLYTKSSKIKDAVSKNKFNSAPKWEQNFQKNFLTSETANKKATSIDIKFSNTYKTSYKYENNKYIKSMDGKLATDANTKKPLAFTNLIIQKTDLKVKDSQNHLDINLIGSGEGYLISNGFLKEITWFKGSEYSKTELFDAKGNEIKLEPGNTIWSILDKSSTITVN